MRTNGNPHGHIVLRGGNLALMGVMVERNLFAGSQKIPAYPGKLQYGVSVTDECVAWDTTEQMLLHAHENLARTDALAA